MRCGTESAEIPEIDDFIAWDSYIHLKPAYLESLMPGTYMIWVFDKRDPYNKYTNSCLFYVVADPAAEGRATLAPEDTDRFYVNRPENLRFIASEALEPDSVWVDGKPLDPNCCELSNLGQRLTLRASFLGTLHSGTHTVSAVTRRGIAVEAEFHGWYVISASSPALPSSVPLDHGYLMLHPGDSVQLDTVGLTGYRKESLRWAASSDGAVPGGTNGTTVISVNETGLVTALEAGTAYAVAYYPNYGTAVASCRVDVAGSKPDGRFVDTAISHVRLADPKATVELYSADYTRVELIPVLTQNLQYANDAFAPVRPDPIPEDGGCAIRSVRFAEEDDPKNAGLSERFTLHVVDDRTVEIVPTEEAIMGSVHVNGSYKVKLAVAMDIDKQKYTTEPLTITVKKTLPKVAAGAVKLNSFLPNDAQTVVFTGTELELVRPDPAKTQPGDWLRFDKDSLRVSYEGPLDAARSGKLNLLVKPRGWNVELPVTVTVSAAKSAPKLTLKPNSLNLRPGAKDFSAAEAAVSPEGYSDSESWPLKVLSVKEGRNERPNDLDVRVSGHTVFVQEGARPPKDGKAHTYKVTLALMRRDRDDGSFAETSVQTTLTVKLLAASTKLTMSAKAAGSIDTAIPASPATLSVTVSGAGAGAVWLYPEDIRIMKEKSRVQSEDVTGRFEITQTGPTAFTLTEKTPGSLESGYTYTAYITKAPGCHAKLPVKFSSPAKVQPSVTLKAAGAIDVIRPRSEVTVTPTVKNCFTYVPGRGDLRILRGGTDVTDDETLNPFAVSVKDGVFVLRLRVMDNETDYTKEKFKVKLVAQMETVGEDGLVKSVAVSSKELAVTIKMGSAGVAASEKTVTLLSDDCNDQALLTLKATEAALAGIARVEMMISPQDKKGHDAFELIPLGSGKYAIGYNGNKLPLPGFKGGTVKLNVFLWATRPASPTRQSPSASSADKKTAISASSKNRA